MITLPTRIFKNSATLIDHILTTQKGDTYDCGIIETLISDHMPTFFIKHRNKTQPSVSSTKFRNFDEKSVSFFKSQLESSSWDSVLYESNVQLAYENFFSIIETNTNSAFPEKNKSVNNKIDHISHGLLRVF